MKKSIFLILILIFSVMNAQQYPFSQKWKEVEKELNNGKLKSVEPLLNDIYNAAKKENNAPNLIKALIFKSNIAVQTSDDENIVTETEKHFLDEIQKTDGVEKAVLQSLLAELYFNYYQENQYRFHNRSDLAEDSADDFRTWDRTRFLKETSTLLQQSLEQKNLLSQSKIEQFDILLQGEDKWSYLRPTMYDVLAHRALHMYQNHLFNNQGFNQAEKDQEIERVYTNLIGIHKKDREPSALIEAELQKLKYDFTDQTKTEDYQVALGNLYKKYEGKEWATNILYELAQAKTNQSEDENDYIKTVTLCEQAIVRFPKSIGAQKCELLKEQITYPELSFETDGTLFFNQYNPLYIRHKNADKIYYRIYKLTPTQYAKHFNGFDFDYQTKTLKTVGNPTKTGEIQLKKFTDYKTHSTVYPLEPLDAGNYILIISNNADFKGNLKNHLFHAAIVSTGIEVATRNKNTDNESYQQGQIVDKKTGLPIQNEKIQILKSRDERPFTTFKNSKSDEFGRFDLKGNERDYYNRYVLKTDKEPTYFPVGIHYYRNDRNKEDDWQDEIVFFTDRGIYRPGQTVYFKAILYNSKGKERKIVPNQKNTIYLDDYNGEEIEKIELTSNEFGSVHGEFVLPTSGLTGNFELTDDWSDSGYKTIRVEEYKRPKFKVEMDTLKGVYQLNEKVLVSGKAQMFSGANVSDAKVVYRVYRQAYNPYRWWWRPMQEEEVEMTRGETTTDAEGKFSFEFEALPAKPKQPNQNRAYIYKIVADVVDISGETHTAESSVRIGDIPLQIGLDVQEKIETDDFKSIKIKTTNLNGADTEAEGNLTITEILPLDRVLRDAQKQTDYALVPKEEFIQKLPYIAYENEHMLENRKRGKVVLNQNWNTAKTDSLTWKKTIKPGTYEVKATSIFKNDTIESIRVVEIFDRKKSSDDKNYFTVKTKENSLQPGDKAEILFSSDAKNAHVLVELEANEKIIRKEILDLNNSKSFTFPIEEAYRGGVFVHYYFNKFNETKSATTSIDVPFDNKKLDITTSVLRNKLEPGQEETWTLTIKDKKGDQFLAEVLAGMYDKSLDEFVENPWDFFPYANNYAQYNAWSSNSRTYFRNYNYRDYDNSVEYVAFEDLNLYGLSLNEFRRNIVIRGMTSMKKQAPVAVAEESADYAAEPMGMERGLAGSVAGVEVSEATYIDIPEPEKESDKENLDLTNIPVRKNLQETAFFFPNLKTDEEGNVQIEFITPESLTAWNFQTVAHTKDLKIGTFQSEIVTQKELMVVPNAPRFLREGDELVFKSKIINLSDKDVSGNAQLLLFDAFTMQPIDAKFDLQHSEQNFSVKSGGNSTVAWTIKVPKVNEVQSVIYRVVASTGAFSDGEENALPILTNRMLVTETLPMSIRENQTKTFTFDKLKNTTSNTRENFKLTMEMTANPVWYAVMALPYLREYPYECSEQIFSRFYGNVISQQIVNSNPKIKAVFDDWNRKGELISPLEKNQELKNILLEETPWVRDAQNESEQMKRISVLFDLNKMRNELKDTYRKLEQKQSANGGFPWFEGGRESVYITTHIVSGFGHLDRMGMKYQEDFAVNPQNMITKAIQFIDNEMEKDWDKYQSDKKRFPLSNYSGMYWLYARSYFLDTHPLNQKMQKVRDYFIAELDKNKFKESLQTQGMLALVLQRYGKTQAAKDLVFSIKDRAVESDEMGMYWKENVSGYRWYEAPVETQALVIEAFDEITPNDVESVESMKVWLLKNKQTHQWTSTKATTEAVYALMNTGKDWANAKEGVTVKIGNDVWYSADVKPNTEVQSGSGYVKESWNKQEITPEMAMVEIEKTSPGVAWGAMYWQYFEDLDKISGANTNVKFRKQLFIQRNTDQGPKLFEITANAPIEIGDLVKVRLEIQTDRAMEFVHIKDMRASGFEPVNVLSSYKWQDGLGYYESTRDAATNFFIDYLPKGVYVFEYDLRANNAGTFSNGITQLQNMYAPEFSAHSNGVNVEITD